MQITTNLGKTASIKPLVVDSNINQYCPAYTTGAYCGSCCVPIVPKDEIPWEARNDAIFQPQLLLFLGSGQYLTQY